MNRDDFCHPENWQGGPTYGLTLAYPPGEDARLLRALQALVGTPSLRGPWSTPEQYPTLTPLPTVIDREEGWKVYGLLHLANGTGLGCILYTILNYQWEENNYTDEEIALCVYRGMQERAFGVVYSDYFRRDNPWFDQIDSCYLALAEAVFAVAPFNYAIIDHEGLIPWGQGQEAIITAQLVYGGLLLPPVIFEQFASQGDWQTRPSGLHWLPPREK